MKVILKVNLGSEISLLNGCKSKSKSELSEG